MIYLCISMTVTLEAVFSLGVGSSVTTLAAPGVVCDDWGRPRIPGGQVGVRVRHAAAGLAHNLGQPDLATELFRVQASRAPLHFADLPGVPGLPELRQHEFRAVALDRWPAASALLLDEPTLDGILFHSARAITGQLDSLPQLGLLWAALRMAASLGSGLPQESAWAALDLEVRYATDGPPDLAAPCLDAVTLGQMLRQIARRC